MGCACAKNRQKFEVVTEGGAGKVVFGPSSEATCKAVSGRYPGSIVREKGAVSNTKAATK
ncbi:MULTISPECIES: hypothetical protein [unclassified Streptomyces]|uniref:hypothetical protein n=1 Tax=unclassified Streptomyces TaxID=2593676 RepID=UPI00093B8745|nr:hypothetical protein [Streptomyces sp. TSRI0281]OKI35044.1 hypothetical protein A6A29_16615 [Streptomyces sp. TSRI0281]